MQLFGESQLEVINFDLLLTLTGHSYGAVVVVRLSEPVLVGLLGDYTWRREG